jgi:hypothetical protein
MIIKRAHAIAINVKMIESCGGDIGVVIEMKIEHTNTYYLNHKVALE